MPYEPPTAAVFGTSQVELPSASASGGSSSFDRPRNRPKLQDEIGWHSTRTTTRGSSSASAWPASSCRRPGLGDMLFHDSGQQGLDQGGWLQELRIIHAVWNAGIPTRYLSQPPADSLERAAGEGASGAPRWEPPRQLAAAPPQAVRVVEA
ncbi:unnamed protein product [Prorocentrum cordatum]|uniref:Poly(ADP-ribose) glycohydrolase n=1 Tax=Prorocentrum cordatum TaxID=2364126 RepID=A0ABN9TL65_9DINO|nr:unnamed protein product [Polarella glacialis]